MTGPLRIKLLDKTDELAPSISDCLLAARINTVQATSNLVTASSLLAPSFKKALVFARWSERSSAARAQPSRSTQDKSPAPTWRSLK
eukprot:CAMPEP_0175949174 /NCGR_PEP_ID=MMETSP0108-20121206/28877_1 /TAXON_ID=195067 ORGANISM="Goniomonas pacifica, Strain CCMP1869" /NCGR_SAMPLE_ID=MMETSP0108 /ASSEMBLY_ACC=CAM_ASM_000204 /LENGTH=86 /DNA_ID=CAMNT_0017275051 /DNA_START=173 /DNA_END=431 /DNA_ORIENTATION=-